MKIAVSTQDGKTICGELGKCTQFIIFDADKFGIKGRELRDTHTNINLIQDCQAVITQGMGRGMYEGLYGAGIIPVITLESHPESAVRQFISGGIAANCGGASSCGNH